MGQLPGRDHHTSRAKAWAAPFPGAAGDALLSPQAAAVPVLLLASVLWLRLQGASQGVLLFDGAIAAVVFAAAAVSSIAGFAFSPLAGTLLIYLLPAPAALVSLLATCSIAIQLYTVASLWRSIDWRRLAPFLAGGAVTLPFGLYALVHAAPEPYRLGLGGFVIVYGLYVALGPKRLRLRPSTAGDAIAGALGGISGGLAAFPGAPVTIWCGLCGGDKTTQRSIYQPYILLMQVAAMLLLPLLQPTAGLRLDSLPYAPAALAGAMVGLAIFRRLSDLQFRWVVLALLMISGVGLLYH